MRKLTCCFTGHRKIAMEHLSAAREQLRQAILRLTAAGYCDFCAGGALGFDTLAAQMVLMVQKQHPEVRLIMALPCPEQADRWPIADRKLYEELKRRANQVVYVSDHYSSDCMHRRNRWLVDHSSYCLAWLTDKSGGTAYTVGYAYLQGVPVENLADQCV